MRNTADMTDRSPSKEWVLILVVFDDTHGSIGAIFLFCTHHMRIKKILYFLKKTCRVARHQAEPYTDYLHLTKRVDWRRDVRATARLALHLQLDISGNAFEIRAVQSPKCIGWCVVVCTFRRQQNTWPDWEQSPWCRSLCRATSRCHYNGDNNKPFIFSVGICLANRLWGLYWTGSQKWATVRVFSASRLSNIFRHC
jgi:hypothetical protein